MAELETVGLDIAEIIARIQKKHGTSTEASHNYECKICNDNGFIYETDEENRLIARKCDCLKAKESKERIKRSGLADAIDSQTFASFITRTPIQSFIKDTAQKYLKDVLSANDEERKPWLYIGGNPGCGKTHICTAICGELLEHNYSVRYIQWLNESRKLKALVNDPDFEENMEEYINVSVLYIDDLLKQKYTENPQFSEADIKIAFSILNARYLLNKPTIISSEWNLNETLLPVDEGVFSRVYERCRRYNIFVERKMENNFRIYRDEYEGEIA